MRIGFAGLATSHPFADAASAASLGQHELVFWEPRNDRAAKFAAEYEAWRVPSLTELVAARPGLVIVSLRPDGLPHALRTVLKAGIPTFVHKVAAPHRAGLLALTRAVHGREHLVSSSSVLRFAPAIRRLRAELAERRILALRVVVAHDIAGFLEPARRWQDDPAIGGGTAVSVGVHGWDLASATLGGAVSAWGGVAARRLLDTSSEDVALLVGQGPAGEPITIEVIGAVEDEWYEVVAVTEQGEIKVRLGDNDEDDAFGYVACLNASLAAAENRRSAIPWTVVRSVIEASIVGAEAARRSSQAS